MSVGVIAFNVVRVLIAIDLFACMFDNLKNTTRVSLPLKDRVFSLFAGVVAIVLLIVLLKFC